MPRELLRANATPFDEGFDAEAERFEAEAHRNREQLALNEFLLKEARVLVQHIGPAQMSAGLARRVVAAALARVWRESRRVAAQHIEQGVEPPPW